MVHVTLLGGGREGVEHLVHAGHGQGGDVHDLGLAALEESRTVSRRQHAHLGRHGAQIARSTTVDADALVDDALAHQLLGEGAHGFLHFLLATGERRALATQLLHRGIAGGVGGGVAIGLAGDLDGVGQQRSGDSLDGGEHVVGVIENGCVGERGDGALGGDHRGHQLTLQRDGLLDVTLRGLETTGEHGLVHLGRTVGVVLEGLLGATGFHHHDGDVAVVQFATGHDQFERALFTLGVGGVGNPRAVLSERDAHGSDGALERDARDHQSGRSGVDAEHVVRVHLIGTQHGEHDLHFVAEAVGERRTQRAVGQTAGEDGAFAGATFTSEERTGNLAGRVGPLFHVDGEGEEVHTGADIFGCVRGGENDAAANAGDHRSLALESQFAGLERQGLVGAPNGTRHSDGIGHDELLSRDADPFRIAYGAAGRFPVGGVGTSMPAGATDNRTLVCSVLFVLLDGRAPQRRRPNLATISR